MLMINIFTAWVTFYSATYFCNATIAGLGEILSCKNFLAVLYLHVPSDAYIQVDERIRKEVERECSKLELMLEQQKQLLRDKEKAYLELEEEFRQALRIEASRYHELQAAHQVQSKIRLLVTLLGILILGARVW